MLPLDVSESPSRSWFKNVDQFLSIDFCRREPGERVQELDRGQPNGLIFQCRCTLSGLKIRVSPVRSWASAPHIGASGSSSAVECLLAKEEVASSNLVFRSSLFTLWLCKARELLEIHHPTPSFDKERKVYLGGLRLSQTLSGLVSFASVCNQC